jgi:hypothetical protein
MDSKKRAAVDPQSLHGLMQGREGQPSRPFLLRLDWRTSTSRCAIMMLSFLDGLHDPPAW